MHLLKPRRSDEDRQYMRGYMRSYRRWVRGGKVGPKPLTPKRERAGVRALALEGKIYGGSMPKAHTESPGPQRGAALYDPIRDGTEEHRELTARLMGDPPPGRRELLARMNRP
jgi:hypothetical protein